MIVSKGRGRPRKTWRRQMDEEIKKVGLSQEDALNRLDGKKDWN